MYQSLKTGVWAALIFFGTIAVLATYAAASEEATVLVGLAVIGSWFGWAKASGWLFGLKRRVASHMNQTLDRVTFVSKRIGSSRIADYKRTLESLCESQTGRVLGAAASSLAMLKHTDLALEKVDWETVQGEDENLINLPANAVYFLRHEGRPLVIRITSIYHDEDYELDGEWSTSGGSSLELCAESLDHANQIIRWISSQTSQHSIYRGCVLQVASPAHGANGQTIRISTPPTASRAGIVLPDRLIELIQRLVHGSQRHHEQLAKLGHSTKMGLILHGPPGTGKTLVIRYLIASCSQHTTVVPSDMAVETLRESFRLAKYLQPSILVIEDVDLLASKREQSQQVDSLQELMNEMDGLRGDSNVMVLLSTNRPESLEPALASRPGRVSQAVEFPLPDLNDRKQLLSLFLGDASPGSRLIEHWAERTEDASPAFLEELCRRAILLASEQALRHEPSENENLEQPIEVHHNHLDEAMHELVVVGGNLTSNVLGFPQLTSDDL